MANCSKIKAKPHIVCAGDLKSRIQIYNRSISAPLSINVDFQELFTQPITTFAMIETANGETIFDSTNIEKVVTHNFYIRAIKNLTSEGWILFKQKYYDILTVENLNEEDRFMLIKANLRGTEALAVNFA